jgi:hypothetical protein
MADLMCSADGSGNFLCLTEDSGRKLLGVAVVAIRATKAFPSKEFFCKPLDPWSRDGLRVNTNNFVHDCILPSRISYKFQAWSQVELDEKRGSCPLGSIGLYEKNHDKHRQDFREDIGNLLLEGSRLQNEPNLDTIQFSQKGLVEHRGLPVDDPPQFHERIGCLIVGC